jgi:FkbM family methyltransferase
MYLLRFIEWHVSFWFNLIFLKLLLIGRVTAVRPGLKKLGTDYGGWIVPVKSLTKHSVCYSAGAGEDISFDLLLSKKTGCTVHVFDPTPRSLKFLEKYKKNTLIKVHAYGLWSKDKKMKFFEPMDSGWVSHSVVNIQHTDNYFIAECKRLKTVMRELKHSRIDLLKLDISGAEHEVLHDMIRSKIYPKVLCIEFDQPTLFIKIYKTMKHLWNHNYELVAQDRWNFTFVRKQAL